MVRCLIKNGRGKLCSVKMGRVGANNKGSSPRTLAGLYSDLQVVALYCIYEASYNVTCTKLGTGTGASHLVRFIDVVLIIIVIILLYCPLLSKTLKTVRNVHTNI